MDKLDILNRDEFVEQLVRLIENISDNKTSTCFAINGAWGCGKSFVLDMFEGKLSKIHSEETFNEKYFIVSYNCWKYDYYEEPLIAIVTSIIAEIDKKVSFFPNSQEKQEIIGMFKATGAALLSIANEMVKSKIGVDFIGSYEKVKEGEKAGTEKYEKEHAYDTYLGLNKVIDKLSELLQDIAERYTVVIIVDELDRCIPDYALKILERLHHLTEEKENVITVIAVDKKQLLKSVEYILGIDNSAKYLEKFINFEIELDKGEVSEKITEKYFDYINLFDNEIIPLEGSIEEYIQIIFKDIDPRTQDRLMRRAMLIHKLLYSDKKDYSFMCVELLATVMYYYYGYREFIGTNKITVNSFDTIFTPYSNSEKPPLVEFFSEKFKRIQFDINSSRYSNEPSYYTFPETLSLPSTVLFTWYLIHNNHGGLMQFKYTKDGVYEPLVKNANELKKFIETMRIIK